MAIHCRIGFLVYFASRGFQASFLNWFLRNAYITTNKRGKNNPINNEYETSVVLSQFFW